MARMNLDGAHVVITGGASGIGRALAETVTARGATAVILDRHGAEEAAAAIGGIGVTVDVCDLDGLEAACAGLDRVDVLVANAGVAPETTSVVDGDRDAARRVLDVNLHGVWNTVWAGAPRVVERQGHIVLVSSVAAFLPPPATAAYGASKAGVEQLSRAMRIELAHTGTTVGVTHYGLIDTPLLASFVDDPLAKRIEELLPGVARVRSRPQDVARAVAGSIERRAARTIYPRLYEPLYLLRGVLGPVYDFGMTRLPVTRALMRDLRERDHATLPVG